MIQSGHGMRDGRTDGRSETSIPPQQLRGAGGIIMPEYSSMATLWSKTSSDIILNKFDLVARQDKGIYTHAIIIG